MESALELTLHSSLLNTASPKSLLGLKNSKNSMILKLEPSVEGSMRTKQPSSRPTLTIGPKTYTKCWCGYWTTSLGGCDHVQPTQNATIELKTSSYISLTRIPLSDWAHLRIFKGEILVRIKGLWELDK